MNTHSPDSDLTRHLARKADEFDRLGGSPLDLSQVLDRAGEIRRGRRLRATMVMAAAVLAIAVPTAVVTTSNHHAKSPVTPAKQVKVDRSPITLDGLSRSNAPHLGYAVDGTFERGNGAIGLPKGRVAAVAPIDGGVMVAVSSDSGDLTAHFVDDQGGRTTEQVWPMQGGFAVSDGGNVAAFVQPDGTVVAVQDAGSRYFEVGTVPDVSGDAYFEAAAVVGENCSGRSEETGCTVYVENKGTDQRVGTVSPHQDSVLVRPALKTLIGVNGAGMTAGITSVTDTGSCSAVLDEGDDELWKTCDHRFLSFAPDGNYLLASAAYADGAGDTELTVLDAHTSRTVLDLTTAEQAFIYQMVWEDDQHVLATVYQSGRWGVLRINLNGQREYAVPPVEASDSEGDFTSPFLLPEN